MPVTGLRFLVIDRISARLESATQNSLNRALSLYNEHPAEARPRGYARVLFPLRQLLSDLVGRGISEGVFRPGVGTRIHSVRWNPSRTASIVNLLRSLHAVRGCEKRPACHTAFSAGTARSHRTGTMNSRGSSLAGWM